MENDRLEPLASVATIDRQRHSTGSDTPRRLRPSRGLGDRIFRGLMRCAGGVVLAITGGIGVFLGIKAYPVLRDLGWSFFTTSEWDPDTGHIGIEAVLLGTFECAAVAITVAFPLALGLALFISEYAGPGLKRVLISLVDLMAAIPSVVFGLWGVFFLMPRALYVSHWIAQNFGWIPIFKVDTTRTRRTGSRGLHLVAVHRRPRRVADGPADGLLGDARGVLAVPTGREGGGPRAGVDQVGDDPHGAAAVRQGRHHRRDHARPRAGAGETISALMILSIAFDVKIRILELGGATTSVLIASRFGDSTSFQLSALLAAGLVLFLITLVVNMLASIVVSRSRSGASSGI